LFQSGYCFAANSKSLPKYYNPNDCKQNWDQFLEQLSESEDDSTFINKFPFLINKCDDDLKLELLQIIKKHNSIGYKKAKKAIFTAIDNHHGYVCGVYTEKCIKTKVIPNPRIMNCEHTWPRSQGATGIALSDLHHLFPVDARMNSMRGNIPFCEVENENNPLTTTTSIIGRSKWGTRCFEPPSEHKGDVARAMFYFAIRYEYSIDWEQEYFFRRWMTLDPPSQSEQKRNNHIEYYQANRNLLVDYPVLVNMITDF